MEACTSPAGSEYLFHPMTTEMPLAAERDWPLFRVHSPIVACLDSGAMQSNESVEEQAGRRPLCSSAAAQGSWQGWRRGRRAPQPNPISLVAAAPLSTPSRMRFGPAHRILNAGRSRESAEAICSLVPHRPVTVVLIPGGLAPLCPGPPFDVVGPDYPYGDGSKDSAAKDCYERLLARQHPAVRSGRWRFSDQVSRRQAKESLQTRRSQRVIQCAHVGNKKGPSYGDP